MKKKREGDREREKKKEKVILYNTHAYSRIHNYEYRNMKTCIYV